MERSEKQPAAFTMTVLSPRAFRQCLRASNPPHPAHMAVPGSRFSSGGKSLIDLISVIAIFPNHASTLLSMNGNTFGLSLSKANQHFPAIFFNLSISFISDSVYRS